jgi:hypothetical protein
LPNKLVMFFGGANPKVMWIMRQTISAKGNQRKDVVWTPCYHKNCWIDVLE